MTTGTFFNFEGNRDDQKTHAQPLRQNQLHDLVARPQASRLIATIGIVVMTVGLYVPVAGRDVLFHSDPISRSSETWTIGNSVGASFTFHLRDMSLPAQLGFDVVSVYSVLMLGGLALIPLLWRPLSARGQYGCAGSMPPGWRCSPSSRWLGCLRGGSSCLKHPSSRRPKPSHLEASHLLAGALSSFPLGVLAQRCRARPSRSGSRCRQRLQCRRPALAGSGLPRSRSRRACSSGSSASISCRRPSPQPARLSPSRATLVRPWRLCRRNPSRSGAASRRILRGPRSHRPHALYLGQAFS